MDFQIYKGIGFQKALFEYNSQISQEIENLQNRLFLCVCVQLLKSISSPPSPYMRDSLLHITFSVDPPNTTTHAYGVRALWPNPVRLVANTLLGEHPTYCRVVVVVTPINQLKWCKLEIDPLSTKRSGLKSLWRHILFMFSIFVYFSPL